MGRYVSFLLVLLIPWMVCGCSDDKPQQLKPVQARSSAPPERTAPEDKDVTPETEPKPEKPVFI